jgi:hypothetical protein
LLSSPLSYTTDITKLLEEAVKMPEISTTAKGLSIAFLGAAYTFLGRGADANEKYESAIEFAKQNKVYI